MEIKADPRNPADADYLDLTVPANWLGQSALTSVKATPLATSGLVFAGPEINGNTARFFVTGGHIGTHRVTVEVVAGTRKRVVTLLMPVRN